MLLLSFLTCHDLFDVPAPYDIKHSIQSISDIFSSIAISAAYLNYRRLTVDMAFSCRGKHMQLPELLLIRVQTLLNPASLH
jgi:hypothetical protein